MNNADLFWDRFEAIAWVINESSACVDYIDTFAPYDLELMSEYDMYLGEPGKYKDEVIVLSRWYKEHQDKEDSVGVYDFFKLAFNQQLLDKALNVGSDEAIADFLKHAYAKSNVKTTDHDLSIDIEVIHDIMNEKQQEGLKDGNH
mgnify:FL=1